MATARSGSSGWLLAAVAAAGLAAMTAGPLRDPLRAAEARTIFIGREVMAHGLPACRDGPTGSLADLACAEPGSAALAPVAIALADSAGGLLGARLLGVLLGLAVVLLVAGIAAAPAFGGRGLLSAALFLALGLPWPLAAYALPRSYAAALLAASVLLLEEPAGWRPGLRLPLAAAALSLAAMTSYAVAVFALPLTLLVLVRHRRTHGGLPFLLPLGLALAAYAHLGVGPAWGSLQVGLDPAWTAAGAAPRLGRMASWLSMPCLLAAFGLFRRDGSGSAARLVALAACAFAVPLLSARVEDHQAATLAALVLLAPAAAQGVERMGELCSASSGASWLRPAFSAAVLLVVAVYGLEQSRLFREAEADLSEAVALLRDRSWPGMTVTADSDYGSPEYVYRYHLERDGSAPRVAGLARASDAERRALLKALHPDYVVLDQHHSPRSFERATAQYLEAGYLLAGTWPASRAPAVELLRVLARERRSGP